MFLSSAGKGIGREDRRSFDFANHDEGVSFFAQDDT
jgi:hypothetical protein